MKLGEQIAAKEDVSPDEVIIANGSTPLLATFSLWAKQNDKTIITSALTYEGVPRVAEAFGVPVSYTPTKPDLGYDLEAIAAQVKQALVFIFTRTIRPVKPWTRLNSTPLWTKFQPKCPCVTKPISTWQTTFSWCHDEICQNGTPGRRAHLLKNLRHGGATMPYCQPTCAMR